MTAETDVCTCVVDVPRGRHQPIYIERCPLHEAAPLLLEALERYVEIDANDDDIYKRARAAIAAARGTK